MSALAHDPFEVTTNARVRSSALHVVVTMSRSSALALAEKRPASGVGFAPQAFPEKEPALRAAAAALFEIESRGRPLRLLTSRVRLTEENDVEFLLVYRRPASGPLTFRAVHVPKLSADHGNAIRVTQDYPGTELGFALLRATDPVLNVRVRDAPGRWSGSAREGTFRASAPTYGSFLGLGVRHILTGYDHLLFLAGLLLPCRRVRSLLLLVSAFTLAHSLTLALAALDLVTLPSALIEPLIAASVLFVGVENLFRMSRSNTDAVAPRVTNARLALVLAFGLIHGFGFAGALREMGLGRAGTGVAMPLFSFNLGVELGQVLVAALALPFLAWIRTRRPVEHALERYGSAGIAAAGAYWLVTRTLFG